MEGTRLELLEDQLELDTRESETRKVQSNMDNTVTYLHIVHQEERR